MRSGAMQRAVGATSGRIFRHMYDEVGSRAEKARPVLRDSPLPGRPWRNPEHSLWATQHHKGRSFFQLLEYGLENDVLETIKRGRAAFDFHTENCALPGSQEEFGEIHRMER